MISNSKQKNELQKITIYVPKLLLEDAQNATENNITETVKAALGLLITERAAQNLRKMRGKVKFSINIEALREDK
jgi:hypothetical protein